MKIAISSKGDTLDSQADPRFGRASYLLVIDTQTHEFDVINNTENKNAFKGAGIKAAAAISDHGAQVLLTGFCGPNAFKTLEAAGIKVVNDQTGSIKDIIQNFESGKVEYAAAANKDGHW